MRRWLVMLAALLAFLMLPSMGTELSQLRPAAVMYVRTEGKSIRIETDTVDAGSGETLDAALQDLVNHSQGTVYLNTVERLLITDSTVYLLPQLREILRPTVRICMAKGEQDLVKAGAYLQTHIPKEKLSDAYGKNLEVLYYKEGRYILE